MNARFILNILLMLFSVASAQSVSDSLVKASENQTGKTRVNTLNKLALELINFDRYSESLEYANQALESAETLNYDEGRVTAYNNLNAAYTYLNQLESALVNGERALSISRRRGFRQAESDALRGLGISYSYLGKTDQATDFLNESIHIAEEIGYKFGIASGYTSLAIVYTNEGKTAEALRTHKLGGKLFSELSLTNKAAHSYLNIGSIYTNILYDFENGLDYTLRALSIFESRKDTFKTGYCLLLIGIIYDELDNFDKSLEYFTKSQDIFEAHNNQVLVAINLNNIGELYKKREKYKEALGFYNRSLEINSNLSRKVGIAVALNNIGECNFYLGKLRTAEEYYKRSLSILESLGDVAKQAISKNNLGKLYAKRGQNTNAVLWFEAALKDAEASQFKEQIRDIYQNLADTYKKSGKEFKALEYYELYSAEKDSLIASTQNIETTRLQIKFETERKEKEIELLKKNQEIKELELKERNMMIYYSIGLVLILIIAGGIIYIRGEERKKISLSLEDRNKQINEQKNELQKINTELKTINEKLTRSEIQLKNNNEIKDKFFSIISHDLKSPFTSLLGMSDILYEDIDEMSMEEIKKYANELNSVAINLYYLLENLLEWSLTQKESFKAIKTDLDLGSTTQECLKLFERNFMKKEIDVKFKSGKNIWIHADKNMISSVIRNLVNNAIKFSNRGGKIDIAVSSEHGNAIVKISDNGIGIENKKLKNIYLIQPGSSTPGTENEKGTGLGLPLSKDFVELNDGKLEISSESGMGTHVKLLFPLRKKG
ncbi:MAG: hypothetical protein SCALA702_10810 [Melioribacteraceae bacterium]|nr:MAG: hypothetical protein SCALA702_10810 [Melioribacteraceae bacterium]